MQNLTTYAPSEQLTVGIVRESGVPQPIVAAYLAAKSPENRVRNTDPLKLAAMLQTINQAYFSKTDLTPPQVAAMLEILYQYGNLSTAEIQTAFALAASGKLGDIFMSAAFTPLVLGRVLSAYIDTTRNQVAAGQRKFEERMEREAALNRRVEPFEWTPEKLAKMRREIVHYSQNFDLLDLMCSMFWADVLRPLVETGTIAGPTLERKKVLWAKAKTLARETEMQDRLDRQKRGQLVNMTAAVTFPELYLENHYAVLWCHEVIATNRNYFSTIFTS
jgi:hypothetical protein